MLEEKKKQTRFCPVSRRDMKGRGYCWEFSALAFSANTAAQTVCIILLMECLFLSKEKWKSLPQLVFETLIEPTAQQGGGISPPQHDFFSNEDCWLIWYVVLFWVMFGALRSIYPFKETFAAFTQVVTFIATWSSAMLFDAVKVSGTRK